MSGTKRCNSQAIFLSGETKDARSFDLHRSEGSSKGESGLRGWGGGDSMDDGEYTKGKGKGKGKGGLRGWDDDYVPSRSKDQPDWEDGFAAGLAAAARKGSGRSFGGERSRSPAGRWGHDLWDGKGKGYGGSWGGDRKGSYSKGGKRGDWSRDDYKGSSKGGKKGRGKDKGKSEETPDASELDADLAKYFGKEDSSKAAKEKDGKEPGSKLDSQLSDYFDDKKASEAKADGGKEDKRKSEGVMAEEKAAEEAKN
uniref:Uncharacterized protein n=1 Tax=Alexandrium catenella TaxID=2925 RepID=A0A7S1WJS3_ALECA|mmetsp:Transcript_67678/g.180111  ORF Transcript_67678/g.180111 Transcript_67678/m.180111 type:complete len:254 (+) Transcript_67678:91-852(+)